MSEVRSAGPFSGWERAIAGRYLRTKKKDGGVALISIISFIGITLAVAGFGPAHLQVTVEDNQLVIQGRRDGAEAQDRAEPAFLHRGIAARSFLRSFVLADGMEVSGATLEHGLLHIDVSRIPPAKLVKRIAIHSAG